MDKIIIKLENVAKKQKNQLIFKDLNIKLPRNEFISIKGPSGCGKTTLLLIISGLEIPDQGKIFINDKLVNSPQIILPPHQRGINLLFQDLALWPHLTGYEQLKFVWESTKIGNLNYRTDELCQEVGLSKNLLLKYPSQLSRGEQQRLAIVRTFISSQPIIFLDEPLTALDQSLRKQFVNFLKKIKQEKKMTVIIVSHDLMTDSINYDQELIYRNFSFIENKK